VEDIVGKWLALRWRTTAEDPVATLV
jgi:hypothetical protein